MNLPALWYATMAFWGELPPGIQAAAISAVATIGTATLGALAVVWQIGRQARHAIEQNRHNEAMKLKLHVYEEVVAICRDTCDVEISLSSYIRNFQMNIKLFRHMSQEGVSWQIPNARAPVLSEKKSHLDKATIEMISLTEKWEIIDLRIAIFRTAINVAKHDIDTAYREYFETAILIMPHEVPQHPQGTLFPWRPPSDQTMKELERLGKNLLDALMALSCYISDFQVEMQNLLVGELFQKQLPPREPIDPELIVVRLDRHEELAEYFETQTAWGREKARVEDEIRAGKSGSG